MSGCRMARLRERRKSAETPTEAYQLRVFTFGRTFAADPDSLTAISDLRYSRIDNKKKRDCCVMMVEVMIVAQQPAMAYDKVSLSTAVK